MHYHHWLVKTSFLAKGIHGCWTIVDKLHDDFLNYNDNLLHQNLPEQSSYIWIHPLAHRDTTMWIRNFNKYDKISSQVRLMLGLQFFSYFQKDLEGSIALLSFTNLTLMSAFLNARYHWNLCNYCLQFEILV